MLAHAIASGLLGVNEAKLPLSLGYVWTEHTPKHFLTFFDNSKIDDRVTKQSKDAAAAASFLLLSSFSFKESRQFPASKSSELRDIWLFLPLN